MDKSKELNGVEKHYISIAERKSINLSGVIKILSFDHEEFLMETTMGSLLLKGNNLEIMKLDTIDGNVAIKGIIYSLNYLDEKKEKESLLNKLFK